MTAHTVSIQAGEAPSRMPVGGQAVVTVRLVCSAGCDLSDVPLEATAPAGGSAAVAAAPVDDPHGPRAVVLTAPRKPGEHVWRISSAPAEAAGVPHDACTLPIGIEVRPCETSLAVWAIPSPVVMGRSFGVKVGAKSSAGSTLAGHRIAVCNESGAVLASGTLGDAPWPGTSALYWTDVQLVAPDEPGMVSWSVKFDAAALDLPHDGTASGFSLAIVAPPEHRLTVRVVDETTAAPVANALVRLGAYRASTGEAGSAEIMMPKGIYDLNVWKAGYQTAPATVEIAGDVTVEIATAAMPEDDPDAVWKM